MGKKRRRMSVSISQNIKVNITHSDLDIFIPEFRIDTGDSLGHLKDTLNTRLGTETEYMSLEIKNSNGSPVQIIDGSDETILSSFDLEDGFTIHVVDTNPESITKQIGDISQVEKYEISDEDYKNRPMNARKFIKNLKQNNPAFFDKEKAIEDPEYMKEICNNYSVGDRCLWT